MEAKPVTVGTRCKLCGLTWPAGKPVLVMRACPKARGPWKLHLFEPLKPGRKS